MPPKSSSKKSAAAAWFHCEKCDAYITSKDRDDHCKICPNVESGNAEYILNGVMYTFGVQKRNFVVAELSELSSKCSNQLLFISEGAMQLAHFRIGQHVVVEPVDTNESVIPLVRIIWPIPDKFLTTIFVSDEDFGEYWAAIKSCTLKVQALPHNHITTIKTLFLRQQNNSPEAVLNKSQILEVQRLLRYELKNIIFTEGSAIYYNFYNKRLEFQVMKWKDFLEDETVETAMNNLHVDRRYCQVSNKTTFEIACTLVDDAHETESNIIVTKADIGGLDGQITRVEEAILFALGYKSAPKGIKIPRTMLLYGYTGCGKTLICEAMCEMVNQQTSNSKALIIKLNTSELFSKFLGETERNLSAQFERAFAHYPQPTLIIVEDVHNLCPKMETNDITKRVCASFATMLDSLYCRREAQRTFVLCTTSYIDKINITIRRCGRLDSEVEIGAPMPKDRLCILNCLLRHIEHSISETELYEVANTTHGYVGADLANLIYNASVLAFKAEADGREVRVEDVHHSLMHIKPSAMREVCIENPNIYWSEIGGQSELKLKLQQSIEWPLLYPEKFKKLGIKPPRGILMYGPPGCSKTMIAKALATESKLNFLSIKGPELFSMWVGESERAVREVFRKARQVAPAIVFFDEIDAIGGERNETGDGGSGSSVKERVLTQLLTELDGVEALENVTIVAATNRPDMIDKALLRPGRIDRIVYVGLPNDDARNEIFRIKLRKMPLSSDVCVDELVKRTNGYSGAEIQAICHEAALKALEESFEAQHVSWKQFEYALDAVQPRTNADLLQLYEDYDRRS